MSKWISVKKRLPRAGDTCLVYGQTKDEVYGDKRRKYLAYRTGWWIGRFSGECHFYRRWEWHTRWHSKRIYGVTHWQHVPHKPRGVKCVIDNEQEKVSGVKYFHS